MVVIGILYEFYFKTSDESYVYFFSQMPIIFLIVSKGIRIPYCKIYKREPEISRHPEKNIDIIPSIIVIMGCAILPFLIDLYIIRNVFNN
jgi:hypothetical protein